MGKSAPKAPDPIETAKAQSMYNTNTAITQQLLNMVNQTNPYGSVNYNQTGTQQFVGADGRTYTLPQFTQSTSFTPEGQGIFDRTLEAQTNLAQTAANQSAAVQNELSNPFEFNNQDAADWAYDLASSRILPQQQQATEGLRNQLINSGLRPGTAAYEREMRRLTQNQGDQLNQLMLTGREQAFNEALTGRNQPLNELNALLSGSQLQNPGTASPGAPQTQVGGVDYTGLVSDNYQAQLQNYQSGLGGLFGLAGTLGGAAIKGGIFSDRRVKQDIKQVGRLDNGLPVYSFRYEWGGPVQIGLMAQDVERMHPDAVGEVDGIKTVDYSEAVL
jgi:hypothetical protein